MLKKWSDVLTIVSGKNQKAVEDSNGPYPIYGSGGIIGYGKVKAAAYMRFLMLDVIKGYLQSKEDEHA